MKRSVFLAGLLMLSACGSITAPVLVVSDNGDRMEGTTTASLSGGTFSVNGRYRGAPLGCSGTYNALDSAKTIAMPVKCTDGRTGMVTATRDSSGMNGAGRVRLTDGSSARFVFGNAALAAEAREPEVARAAAPTVANRYPDAGWLADQMEPFLNCGRDNAIRMGIRLPNEAAGDIATAARVRCGTEYLAVSRIIRANIPPQSHREFLAIVEENFRELVIAVTLQARERLNARPRPAPSRKPPAAPAPAQDEREA